MIELNYEVTKGSLEDYEDIIDFGNSVFNADFPTLQPKLYMNHKEKSAFHYLVKEGNRIKAMAGSFPLELNVCGNLLKTRGIGTVSVHKYSRGSGYMKLLMDRAVSEIEAEGCDFALLGGQRQRYEYWGFTPCGVAINFNVNDSNVKHVKIAIKDQYIFVKYGESKDIDLTKAIMLHDSQLVYSSRPEEDFVEITRTWNNNLIFIYKNNEFCGYLCTSGNYENISEILLQNPEKIDEVLIAYMKNYQLHNAHLVLYLHRQTEIIKMSSLAENYMIGSSTNAYIINYENVIKAFMELKKTFSPLCDGTLVLNIKEKGRYKIAVNGGNISVGKTDHPYDLYLSHLEASALLFSHAAFIQQSHFFTNPIIKDWFPLPLFFPSIDTV